MSADDTPQDREPPMSYDDPSCAYCPSTVRACRQGTSAERGPGFCPSQVDALTLGEARPLYDAPDTRQFAQTAAIVEGEGYGKWTRVEEIVAFAKRMGYRKLGIANCIMFVDFSRTLTGILESHGFEVASVACKAGDVAKEEIGVADAQKVVPGGFEPMCNPIAQAELLDAHGSEFNIVLGLCVGHDSLFFRASKAPATVLVVKDRVLGHNPIAALMLADTYYARLWGPDKARKSARLPRKSTRR